MIRLLSEQEIIDLYPSIFESVFGYYDDKQLPGMVAVQEVDGEVRGFVSGYMINKDSFYYAWGGAINGFPGSRRVFLRFYTFLYEIGVRWCSTHIENVNTVWQRLLMGMGWVPYGLKVTQGKIFIEYYKELTDGDI